MTIIDLTNPVRGQEVLLDDYHQKLPLKRSFLGFNKTCRFTLNIRIVNLEHWGIVIRNETDFVKLKINGREGADLTLEVSEQDLHFSTFINTGEILDCEEIETSDNCEQAYPVRYQIEYFVRKVFFKFHLSVF